MTRTARIIGDDDDDDDGGAGHGGEGGNNTNKRRVEVEIAEDGVVRHQYCYVDDGGEGTGR